MTKTTDVHHEKKKTILIEAIALELQLQVQLQTKLTPEG